MINPLHLSLFFLLLSSCSSTSRSLTNVLKKSPWSTGRQIPVSSRAEAKREIYRKHNFLKLMFEQTRDPYYGVPKWSEECLKENIIKDVTETDKSIVLETVLIMDSKGSVGKCPGDIGVYKNHYLMIYCEGDKAVSEVALTYHRDLDWKKVKLCP